MDKSYKVGLLSTAHSKYEINITIAGLPIDASESIKVSDQFFPITFYNTGNTNAIISIIGDALTIDYDGAHTITCTSSELIKNSETTKSANFTVTRPGTVLIEIK